MKKLTKWFLATKFWKWLLLTVLPGVRWSVGYTKIRGWVYKRGYRKLYPGCIICTVDENKASVLIPGTWSHSALCVAKTPDCEFEVSEMTQHNFTESCFFDICKEADRVLIGICDDWDIMYIRKVIEKNKSFKDKLYDVQFAMNDEALSCSESIYHSDFEHRLKVNLEDIAGLGHEYISPDGLTKASNFRVIWDSEDEFKSCPGRH